MEMQPDVVCMGILVADFFPDLLDRMPDPGELSLIKSIALSTGGCAANTAIALAKLGVNTGVVGRVGDDTFGGFIKRDLEKQGVDTAAIAATTDWETSKTIIIAVKGEDRRYLHLLGANAGFGAQHVDIDYLNQSKVLYVGGFLGIPGFSFKDMVDLLRSVHQRGIKTVLDVIVPEKGAYKRGFQELLPYVDVFLPNSDEAEIITGSHEAKDQAKIFADMGAQTVVITLGGNGSLMRTKDTAFQAGTFAVPFVDGSGAGDAFDAGFIYSMLSGDPLPVSLRKASAMGASCVRALGCADGLFSRPELEDYCRGHDLDIAEQNN